MKKLCVLMMLLPACLPMNRAEDLSALPRHADLKAIDDRCLASYTDATVRCNERFTGDDAAFRDCTELEKTELKRCCRDEGGSETCASAAQ